MSIYAKSRSDDLVIYVVGPAAGAIVTVIVARVFRGPALAQEARAAMGTPLDRG